jgi:hypothetical protein
MFWLGSDAARFDIHKLGPLEFNPHSFNNQIFQEEWMSETETTFHAVEKDGVVTAIWEMQGRKHLRTIDPRSEEGRRILGSYTIDDAAEHAQPDSAAQAAQQGEAQQ